MIKSIGYAYASSTLARRLDADETGCYYVATYTDESDHLEDDLIGPFATIESAEHRAETVEGRWSRYTMRAPSMGGR